MSEADRLMENKEPAMGTQCQPIKVLLVSTVYPGGYRLALPPYNIAYLAAYLRNQPNVVLETVNADEYSAGELDELLAAAKYDVFAAGGMITTYSFCKHIFDVSAKHRPQARRVIGGPITAASLEILFDHLPIDCAVLGEGEKTLAELLEAWRTGGDIAAVKGLAYRPDGKSTVLTPPRPRINLLEEDLVPDWSIIDIEKYVKWNPLSMFLDGDAAGMRQFSVFVGRGCPYKCGFCGSPLGWFRKRKTGNIINEVIHLKEKYGINVIYFMSDIFFANKTDARDFCDKVLDLKLGIRWICNLRVDAADAEIFRLMKKAGCDHVTFGLESGSEAILQKMNKKTTALQNRNAMALARDAGIYPGGAVIFGYMDERLEDVRKTVDMMIEGSHLPSSVSVATPMPGTTLYDDAVARGLIKDHYQYLLKLRGEIGVDNEPVLNVSGISDDVFWPSLIKEKRRLYTAHYLDNRAVFIGKNKTREGTVLQLKCPHCGAAYDYRVPGRTVRLGEQYCCLKCRRLLWVDVFSLPENSGYQQQVTEFINRVNREKASLVFYSANDSARYLFLIDIFGIDFQRVAGVIQDSQDIDLLERKVYATPIYGSSQLASLSPEYILITEAESRDIYLQLIAGGFKADHVQVLTAIPPAPRVGFRRAVLGLFPPALRPGLTRLYGKFMSGGKAPTRR
ncbi:MAG: radical SAM protein [Dehalococcoidales bacterium]|nr:radical SAM protein [Dehalococcoidales bacterium]